MYSLPNMGLLGITLGTDSGLTIELDANINYGLLDGHNHTSGNGVQIPPSGLNMIADLPFQNNNAIVLRSTQFVNASMPLPVTGPMAVLNGTYVAGGNLYFNDAGGNQIQITKSGLVNATSSGIANGTASATFAAGVLVVDANTNTPANIQVASVLLGLNSASTNYLTLSPPASLASGLYTLTLPSNPVGNGITKFVTLDTAGNFGTSSSISATQIVDNSITGAQLANGTISQSELSTSLNLPDVTTIRNLPILNVRNDGTTPNLVMCVESFSSVGSGQMGGMTGVRTGTGQYSITFVAPFNPELAAPSVTATAINNGSSSIVTVTSITNTGCTVVTYSLAASNLADMAFCVHAVGPE